jgi:hypothetical protein
MPRSFEDSLEHSAHFRRPPGEQILFVNRRSVEKLNNFKL